MATGIGPGGRTLAEMLKESEKLYEETGYYYGLQRLELYERDPLKWERDRAYLRSLMVIARETATHIAASPITRSIGETCWVLYTPEGDSVVLSTGIIVHVHTMGEDIKWMIRNRYEENPGIYDGDHFTCNDPALGNVHTSDVHTITPVFYEDQLVAWIGSVTHQVDIGANTPGHDIVTTTSRFEDGLYMEAELTVRDGKMFPHYYERSRRGVRTPIYYDLDEKARIAGNEMAKRGIVRFIEENGLDYYLLLVREIIEKSRRDFISRTKERMVPGRYRAVVFSETPFVTEAWQPHARDDWEHPQPMEITVLEDGSWEVDIEGSAGTGPFPWNGGISPFMGGFWVVATQLIGYGDVVNEGFVKAIKFKIPPKSWAGDPNPYISRNVPWFHLIPQMSALYRAVAMAAFARGIVEEGAAGYGMTADAVQGGGYTTGRTGHPPGLYYPISTFEIAGQGMGANAVRDGLDYGFAMWNPEADIGDVEEWERFQWGFIYLARNVRPNTAGFGERRGGTAYAHVAIFYGSKDAVVQNLNGGKILSHGLYGGYGGSVSYTLLAKGVDFERIISERKPYPISDNPNEPEFEKYLDGYAKYIERIDYVFHYPRPMDEFDMYYFKQNAGQGWGDPLDRPLDLCEKDLNDGIYTADIMKSVYGVVASYDEESGIWKVNREESERLREEIRKKRLEKAVDFGEFYREEREILLTSNFIRPVAKMYQEQKEVSPRWWKEFIEFWQLPDDWYPEAQDRESYLTRVLEKHERLIEDYREYLKSKGYGLKSIQHRTLAERRW